MALCSIVAGSWFLISTSNSIHDTSGGGGGGGGGAPDPWAAGPWAPCDGLVIAHIVNPHVEQWPARRLNRSARQAILPVAARGHIGHLRSQVEAGAASRSTLPPNCAEGVINPRTTASTTRNGCRARIASSARRTREGQTRRGLLCTRRFAVYPVPPTSGSPEDQSGAPARAPAHGPLGR